MNKKLLSGLGALMLLGQTSSSVAYSYYKCSGNKITWASRGAQIRGEATNFSAGSTYGNALTDAISYWNDNPSRFQFSVTLGDTSVRLFNLQNEAWGTDSDYWLDGAPAICYHFLYDLDSTGREDVSVTHWKYKGKSGEYSSHMRGNTYYLGAIIDPDDDIDEVREDNNATYVGIYIK